MIIAHNGTCTMNCNILTDIRIARETGYGGIEIIGEKLYRYLDQGYTVESIIEALDGFPVVAIGYVQDIERQQENEYASLLQECEKMCSMAKQLGCSMGQLLTGPIGPGIGEKGGYQGLMGQPWQRIRDLTAKNLRVLADIGAERNLEFYLEPLSWTPLHRLEQTLELLEETRRDNVKLLIDYWHHWTSGTTPEDIAKLNKDLIACVHFCDSLPVEGRVTHELREVWTGAGHIPLQDWVDAVVSTGFDGWWACELFSAVHWELDPWDTARLLKDTLRYLLPQKANHPGTKGNG